MKWTPRQIYISRSYFRLCVLDFHNFGTLKHPALMNKIVGLHK